jgi:hypothetical protein
MISAMIIFFAAMCVRRRRRRKAFAQCEAAPRERTHEARRILQRLEAAALHTLLRVILDLRSEMLEEPFAHALDERELCLLFRHLALELDDRGVELRDLAILIASRSGQSGGRALQCSGRYIFSANWRNLRRRLD